MTRPVLATTKRSSYDTQPTIEPQRFGTRSQPQILTINSPHSTPAAPNFGNSGLQSCISVLRALSLLPPASVTRVSSAEEQPSARSSSLK